MMIKVIDKDLMAERLSMKMVDKGYAHKNGRPFQLLLAEAIGDKNIQQKLSALLRKSHNKIEQEDLTKIAKALNCQEQWLLGGEYVPLQEKPLFKEELYQPEEKIAEIGNSSILGALESIGEALYMIMRQLQKLNAREEQSNG